jgi:hypothetical protein
MKLRFSTRKYELIHLTHNHPTPTFSTLLAGSGPKNVWRPDGVNHQTAMTGGKMLASARSIQSALNQCAGITEAARLVYGREQAPVQIRVQITNSSRWGVRPT